MPRMIPIQLNIILKPRQEEYKNHYLGQGTFVFTVLPPSKFAPMRRVSGVPIVPSAHVSSFRLREST